MKCALSGLSQLADRLQPRNDFPVRITFLQQGKRHFFDGTGIEPVLDAICESNLGAACELAPGVIVMSVVE